MTADVGDCEGWDRFQGRWVGCIIRQRTVPNQNLNRISGPNSREYNITRSALGHLCRGDSFTIQSAESIHYPYHIHRAKARGILPSWPCLTGEGGREAGRACLHGLHRLHGLRLIAKLFNTDGTNKASLSCDSSKLSLICPSYAASPVQLQLLLAC